MVSRLQVGSHPQDEAAEARGRGCRWTHVGGARSRGDRRRVADMSDAHDRHHPDHRLWPVSRRAFQPDGAIGGGARPAAPSSLRQCAPPLSCFRVSYEAIDRELPALLKARDPMLWSCSDLPCEPSTCASKRALAMLSRAACPMLEAIFPSPAPFLREGRPRWHCARRCCGCSWPRDRRVCRLRSRAMPAITSAIICAGARPRPPAAAPHA